MPGFRSENVFSIDSLDFTVYTLQSTRSSRQNTYISGICAQLVFDLVNSELIIILRMLPWFHGTMTDASYGSACVKVMNDEWYVARGTARRSKDSVANQIFANISAECNENSKNAIKFRCKFLECAHHTHIRTHTWWKDGSNRSSSIHVCLCDDNKHMPCGIRRNSQCISQFSGQNTFHADWISILVVVAVAVVVVVMAELSHIHLIYDAISKRHDCCNVMRTQNKEVHIGIWAVLEEWAGRQRERANSHFAFGAGMRI